MLTSEWKPGYVSSWGRDFAFVFTGEKYGYHQYSIQAREIFWLEKVIDNSSTDVAIQPDKRENSN